MVLCFSAIQTQSVEYWKEASTMEQLLGEHWRVGWPLDYYTISMMILHKLCDRPTGNLLSLSAVGYPRFV